MTFKTKRHPWQASVIFKSWARNIKKRIITSHVITCLDESSSTNDARPGLHKAFQGSKKKKKSFPKSIFLFQNEFVPLSRHFFVDTEAGIGFEVGDFEAVFSCASVRMS